MGLSGRKEKQRIPTDPRNLSWADDAAKFGQNYLSKFGWDSSKGLGAAGDGRKTHIKVSHKLDMLGIGAAHHKDPNGIAWKQNKDFENVLKRLNDSAAMEGAHGGDAVEEAGGVVEQMTLSEPAKEDVVMEDVSVRSKKNRKRKKDVEEATGDNQAKKKRRKSKDEQEQSETNGETKKNTDDPEPGVIADEDASASVTVVVPAKPFVPRQRAHRARAIAAKNITSKSAASISEILGIAPTPRPSVTTSISGTPHGTLTPLDDAVTLEKLTTSTKSVADYFKERLLAKSLSKSGSVTPFVTDQIDKIDHETASYYAPRRGLGSSELRLESTEESTDTQTCRMGISKFSSLMSASFLASTSAPSEPTAHDPQSDEECRRKAEKERKKSTEDTLMRKEEAKAKKGTKERKEKKGKRRKDDQVASIMADGVDQDNDAEKKMAKKERRKDKAERKLQGKKELQNGLDEDIASLYPTR